MPLYTSASTTPCPASSYRTTVPVSFAFTIQALITATVLRLLLRLFVCLFCAFCSRVFFSSFLSFSFIYISVTLLCMYPTNAHTHAHPLFHVAAARCATKPHTLYALTVSLCLSVCLCTLLNVVPNTPPNTCHQKTVCATPQLFAKCTYYKHTTQCVNRLSIAAVALTLPTIMLSLSPLPLPVCLFCCCINNALWHRSGTTATSLYCAPHRTTIAHTVNPFS